MLRALCLTLALALSPDVREGDCPACANELERLSGLSAVSHGPLTIAGVRDSELGERWYGEWIFLETAHFKFASSLGPQALNAKERKELAPCSSAFVPSSSTCRRNRASSTPGYACTSWRCARRTSTRAFRIYSE